jgi:hypothetical protein
LGTAERRLIITIPDVECIGCKTKQPGTLNHLFGEEMRAHLQPPKGWTEVHPQRQSPSDEGEPRVDRMFYVCPRCYPSGLPVVGQRVDAVFESDRKGPRC